MPRKSKITNSAMVPATTRSRRKKYPKDDGPLTQAQVTAITEHAGRPLPQFEIDWERIAANVKEAAELVKKQ